MKKFIAPLVGFTWLADVRFESLYSRANLDQHRLV